MRENATPSEGVQKRFTAKLGLGEVLTTWDIFADSHFTQNELITNSTAILGTSREHENCTHFSKALKIKPLQKGMQFSTPCENVRIARTFPSR